MAPRPRRDAVPAAPGAGGCHSIGGARGPAQASPAGDPFSDLRGAPFQLRVAGPRRRPGRWLRGRPGRPGPARLAARHPAVSHWPSLEAPPRRTAAGFRGPADLAANPSPPAIQKPMTRAHFFDSNCAAHRFFYSRAQNQPMLRRTRLARCPPHRLFRDPHRSRRDFADKSSEPPSRRTNAATIAKKLRPRCTALATTTVLHGLSFLQIRATPRRRSNESCQPFRDPHHVRARH
jgi:hypothetical protein